MLFLNVTPRNYTRIYLQPLLKMQIEIPMRGLGIFIQAFFPGFWHSWELETLQNSSSRSTETGSCLSSAPGPAPGTELAEQSETEMHNWTAVLTSESAAALLTSRLCRASPLFLKFLQRTLCTQLLEHVGS